MRNLMILAPLLSLFACGGADPAAACNDYTAAAAACAEEAFPTATDGTAEPIDVCAGYDNYEGDDADALVEWFDCQTAAWEAADCSTAEGYTAAAADMMTNCTMGAAE